MTAMYIASNNSLSAGFALGDMITIVRTAWLCTQSEPHDRYILSLFKSDPLNFLWSRFIRENPVIVVYDDWPPTNRHLKYQEFNHRRRERCVHDIPFTTYKELYPRLDGGFRQPVLRGKEVPVHGLNIFEYMYFGQETSVPDPIGTKLCDDTIIDFKRNEFTEPNSVFVAIHEKCQGNRVFTLRFWQNVIQELIANNVIVYVNDNTNFMAHLDGHPQFRRVFDPYEKLIDRVASQRLVVCGNTGIGWVAAATGTPFIALERNMHFPEYSFARCGCKSLVQTIREQRAQIVVGEILRYLGLPYRSQTKNSFLPASRGLQRLRGRLVQGIPR